MCDTMRQCTCTPNVSCMASLSAAPKALRHCLSCDVRLEKCIRKKLHDLNHATTRTSRSFNVLPQLSSVVAVKLDYFETAHKDASLYRGEKYTVFYGHQVLKLKYRIFLY